MKEVFSARAKLAYNNFFSENLFFAKSDSDTHEYSCLFRFIYIRNQ